VAIVGTFTALATAARFAIPNYRMDAKAVVAIALIMLAQNVPYRLVTLIQHSIRAAYPTHSVFYVVAGLLSVLVAWITFKWALAPAIYVLRARESRSAIDALRDSWAYVEGGDWWRVVGLELGVFLAVGLVPYSFVLFLLKRNALDGNTMAASAIATFLIAASTMIINAWLQASLVAFASAFVGELGVDRRFQVLTASPWRKRWPASRQPWQRARQ
jgi:hypothetical protein